ncbi:MAG: WHG domain-containing protein [Azospirillaceae bacterium]
MTDSDSTGSDSTGSDSTGSDSTGSDSTGSDSTGSDSTGSDSTGGQSSARASGRAYHHGDLRNALLDAVEAILQERGKAGLTFRECARRAGVSHGAPAHHFGDLSGMMTAFATRAFTRFDEALAAALTGEGTAARRFSALGEAYVDFARHHPGAFSVMFEEVAIRADDAAFRAVSESAFGRLLDGVRALNREAGRDEADGLEARATAAWSLVHGYARLIIEGPFSRPGKAVPIAETLALLEGGIG